MTISVVFEGYFGIHPLTILCFLSQDTGFEKLYFSWMFFMVTHFFSLSDKVSVADLCNLNYHSNSSYSLTLSLSTLLVVKNFKQ